MNAIRLRGLSTVRRPARRLPAAAAAAVLGAVLLAGCGSADETAEPSPVTLSPIAGTDLKQVTLTEEASHRLGIQTATVSESGAAASGVKAATHKVVPYAAVVYDADGKTWTYAETAPRTYRRVTILVATIQGDVAVLNDGPAVGTTVVVVGAPELLGAEAEISGEE